MVARELVMIVCILASISLTESNNVTTQWTTWTSCDRSCYQGTRYRIRICAQWDENCTSLQTEPCNTNACNITNTAFRDTACNATCNNTGWFGRARYCLDPTKPLSGSCAAPTFYKCTGSCQITSSSTLSTHQAISVTSPTKQQSTTDLPCQCNQWIIIAVTGWAFLLVILLLFVGFVIYKRKRFNPSSDRNENTNKVKVRVESPEYEEFSTSANQQPIRSNDDQNRPISENKHEQQMGSKSAYEVPMTNKQQVKLGIMSYSKDDYVELNS